MNRQRIELLSQLKIFQNWDYAKLGGILNNVYVRSPLHGTIVYKAGEINANIYVVVSGELEVLIEGEYVEESRDRVKIKGKSEIKVDFKNEFKKNYKKSYEVPIMKVSEGNYFGDEEGFKEPVKNYTLKVISNNCQLFLIPKDVSLPN
jgi:CRP-like cAMP-binding protein